MKKERQKYTIWIEAEQWIPGAWDIITGERVLQDNDFRPTHYHRGAKQFLCLDAQDGTTVHVGALAQ